MKTGTYYINRRISRNEIETVAEFDTSELRNMMKFVNHLNNKRTDAHYYLNRIPARSWRGEEDPELKAYKYRGVGYEAS